MIKSVLEKAALIISGPLFMFLICELGLRGYYLISDLGAVSLERQLAQACVAGPYIGRPEYSI